MVSIPKTVVDVLALAWLLLGFPAVVAANAVALGIYFHRIRSDRDFKSLAIYAALLVALWLVLRFSYAVLPGHGASGDASSVTCLLVAALIAALAPVMLWWARRVPRRRPTDRRNRD